MPLIDSTTNLKSLKYGNDRPGRANSGQPFVQTKIPENRLNRTSQAGLQFNSALKDTERISKYFLTTKGLIFTANQNILSQIGVKTQTDRIPNEGPYIPTSTLAQVPLGRTGTHLNRNGLNPFDPTGAKSSPNNDLTYSGVVKNTQPINENRLIELKNKNIGDTVSVFASRLQSTVSSIFGAASGIIGLLGGDPSSVGRIQSKITKGLESVSNPILLSYSGGPGSSLGIGKTNIFFADKRTVGRDDKTYLVGLENSPTDRTDLEGKRYTPGPEPIEPLKQKSFSRVNYDRSPGKAKDGNRRDPFLTKGDESVALDKINALPVYRSEGVDVTKPIKDLVKFRFAVIDNSDPNQKDFIHFRAFLNGFTDNYSAQWNGFRYPGRGEQLYKYGGFDRDFSISWTVYAQSKGELMPMYEKLNFLASSLTPDYGTNGFMKGNLVQLTVGGYLYEQPGFINSLTYTAPEDSPYETGIIGNGETDTTVRQLPFRINASTTFIPIHTFRPEKQTVSDGVYGSNKYILSGNDNETQQNVISDVVSNLSTIPNPFI